MKAAGAFEGVLGTGQDRGQTQQELPAHDARVVHRRKLLPHGLDCRLAANAAARRREHVPRQFLEIGPSRIPQTDIDAIALHSFERRIWVQAMRPTRYIEDLRGVAHQSFCHQKAGGQLLVLAGRAHDNGNAPAFDADFQRLFARQKIRVPPGCGAVEALDRDLGDAGVHGKTITPPRSAATGNPASGKTWRRGLMSAEEADPLSPPQCFV